MHFSQKTSLRLEESEDISLFLIVSAIQYLRKADTVVSEQWNFIYCDRLNNQSDAQWNIVELIFLLNYYISYKNPFLKSAILSMSALCCETIFSIRWSYIAHTSSDKMRHHKMLSEVHHWFHIFASTKCSGHRSLHYTGLNLYVQSHTHRNIIYIRSFIKTINSERACFRLFSRSTLLCIYSGPLFTPSEMVTDHIKSLTCLIFC